MAKKPVLTEYSITADNLNSPLCIALITDLHERPCEDMLELLKEAAPDIIAIAGDTLERYDIENVSDAEGKKPSFFKRLLLRTAYYINRFFMLLNRKNKPSDEKTYDFLRGISKIAPVFMSLGNHEEKLLEEDISLINELGITLLNNADATFIYKCNTLVIGGLSSFYDEEWLRCFEKKDGYKILLSHHPIYYDTLIKEKKIDLVLSGHNHGGQIRVSGKGLFSSGEGIPPKYDKGVFGNRLVVSAGCANTVIIPRINNPREILKIKINEK